MSDAVKFQVEPPAEARDRLTALFRPLLVVPHALLVGGPILGLGGGELRAGALGLLALTIALLDWFSILVTGHAIAGLQPLKRLYLCWRARVLAYASFLRDEYPPFGDGPYPASLELPEEAAVRNRATVAARPLLLLPHVLVLVVLMIGQLVVTIVSWVTITLTGRLDDDFWRFSRNTTAYILRIEAYALLVHDRYPPFRWSADSDVAPALMDEARA